MVRLVTLLLCCALLSACTAGDGSGATSDGPSPAISPDAASADGPATVDDAPTPTEAGPVTREGWLLDELTADGTRVALRVTHDVCAGYEGPAVIETDEEVRIAVRYDATVVAEDCAAQLVTTAEVVALPAPLGDRELVGCGLAVCRRPAPDRPLQGSAAVTADVAVVLTDGQLLGVNLDRGDLRWQEPVAGRRDPATVGPLVVLRDDRQPDADVAALDPMTGAITWTGAGAIDGRPLVEQVVGDALLLVRPSAADPTATELALVDAAGTPIWVRDVAGGVTQVDTDPGLILVLSGAPATTPEQPGVATVTAMDPADGGVLWQVSVPGEGYDLVPRRAEGIAALNVLGALYALDVETGATVWQILPAPVDGLVDAGPLLAARTTGTGDAIRLIDAVGAREIGSVADADLPELDVSLTARLGPDAIVTTPGVLTRRGVTAETLVEQPSSLAWRVELTAASGRGVAAGDLVVVPTAKGVRAFDIDTGALRWATSLLD